jgi:AraC-like DNA-binding protein
MMGIAQVGFVRYHEGEYQAQRLQTSREELVGRIGQTVREEGELQVFAGLYMARLSAPVGLVHSIIEPSLCVIVQGSKEVLLGDSRYVYDPSNYLLATLDLPRASQVLEASRERPYLSVRLQLDPQFVSSVMVETGYEMSPRTAVGARAMDVSPLDANLLDAILRLVRLQDSPAEVPILGPIIMREIIYRLLVGNQGKRLRHLTVMAGYVPAITRAVTRIRQEFDQTLRMDVLAQELGMSVSGFYSHFKTVTAMSPLQFQKQLRLQEARRLMLTENLDATSVAYRVGYNDASHFNREYKSVFGIPPVRDIQRLRETSGTSLR